MNFKNLLPIFLCLAAVTLSATALLAKNEKPRENLDLNSLSKTDRFFLHLASKLSPESFARVPKETFAEITADERWPSIDNFFVDARQLFTQAKKLPEDANLPEFNWGYRFAFCIWMICIDIETRYTTAGSQFLGAENTIQNTDISPTKFESVLQIPSFNWTSPGFEIRFTDYINERIRLSQKFFVSFEDLTVAFACDYGFVQQVGLQMDNCTIHFDSGRVRGQISHFTVWDFQGNLLETYEAEEYAYDEVMIEYWGYGKKEYTRGLQHSLNCFLSNARNDPGNCHENDEYLKYYKLINLQLLQTFGLGALLK